MSFTRSINVSVPAILVLVVLVSMSTAAAVTVIAANPDPIVPVRGTLSASSEITVDEQSLNYSGVDVTGLDVVVNNTGATHNGTLHAALKEAGGAVVAQKTLEGEQFPSGLRTVTVTFDTSHGVDEFTYVEVTVEQTD